MLTNATFSSLLLPLLLVLLLLLLTTRGCRGASVTWGQVNKYASTLYAQDVYLATATATADADITNVTDVVYNAQHSNASDYTITAVHAYDMTPLDINGGDGGAAQLLNGGVGQHYATVRLQRHKAVKAVDQLSRVHFQVVIYGIAL